MSSHYWPLPAQARQFNSQDPRTPRNVFAGDLLRPDRPDLSLYSGT